MYPGFFHDAPFMATNPSLATQTLALPGTRVNVKATTGEGIGFVGRREGVAALAVASLQGAD